ncbi:hypothetical protein HID58_057712 [Brassica napus]|uniref:Uncharacterized protein n=1 Tax=Brassica napus TaxID=3708 RepID=A0ABQ8ASR2_BRANA|nr:hypothetical protein HID58_057712 [Brassica napus]
MIGPATNKVRFRPRKTGEYEWFGDVRGSHDTGEYLTGNRGGMHVEWGDRELSSMQLLQYLDKQMRNHISSLQGGRCKKLGSAMKVCFGGR